MKTPPRCGTNVAFFNVWASTSADPDRDPEHVARSAAALSVSGTRPPARGAPRRLDPGAGAASLRSHLPARSRILTGHPPPRIRSMTSAEDPGHVSGVPEHGCSGKVDVLPVPVVLITPLLRQPRVVRRRGSVPVRAQGRGGSRGRSPPSGTTSSPTDGPGTALSWHRSRSGLPPRQDGPPISRTSTSPPLSSPPHPHGRNPTDDVHRARVDPWRDHQLLNAPCDLRGTGRVLMERVDIPTSPEFAVSVARQDG
jgi:hypothetical protein